MSNSFIKESGSLENLKMIIPFTTIIHEMDCCYTVRDEQLIEIFNELEEKYNITFTEDHRKDPFLSGYNHLRKSILSSNLDGNMKLELVKAMNQKDYKPNI